MPTQKKAIVFVANGTEEMEAVITVDILRRAGIDVLITSVEGDGSSVLCSRNVRLTPDACLCGLENIGSYDAVIIPGGAGGADTLSKDSQVKSILADFYAQNKIVAAVCAGSLAIQSAGIQNKTPEPLQITSHPSVKERLERDFVYMEQRVVIDKNLITSRGPGTTFEFALAIVASLVGKEKAQEVAGPMILNFEV